MRRLLPVLLLIAAWSVTYRPLRFLFHKPKPQEIITWHGDDPVIVDLGLPPGFAPVTDDLDALVTSGQTCAVTLHWL